ncbi:hypothetical protein GGS23DRAFT_557743 [Durotheca rogersii]|uniref:uncharacterized protein n=1 Tax=Durotheca rogersii TaxID=419775 RepID=UPI00221F26C6|nr:uncharacterized protein GGS23DRAFT_557743 [Durotheca rogersii]KAI5865113.1 hypothetical protein GGS23DRAFT_557743 [Durotheca rogersii]
MATRRGVSRHSDGFLEAEDARGNGLAWLLARWLARSLRVSWRQVCLSLSLSASPSVYLSIRPLLSLFLSHTFPRPLALRFRMVADGNVSCLKSRAYHVCRMIANPDSEVTIERHPEVTSSSRWSCCELGWFGLSLALPTDPPGVVHNMSS